MALRFLLAMIISITCCLQATAWAEENQQPTATSTAAPTADAPAAETAPSNPVETKPTEEKPAENKTNSTPSWTTFEQAFQAGVALYQSKKFEEAKTAFSFALEKEPSNVQALTNLALVQYQLNQKGWAVALLRKAHNLDPNFSTPKAALDFILPQLDVKEIPHEIQLWETVRSNFIVPFSLTGFLALTALSLFSAGWLLLQYFGRRREALREEKPLPSFPVIGTLISVVFVAFLTLTALKFWDLGMPRGTVVGDKVTVYSAPNDKSVALFDLFSGLEVILNTSDENWVQVTYPGALTGWIPKSSVFQTSGRGLW